MWITFKTTTKANDTVGCSDSVNRKLAKECVSSRGRNVEGSKEGGKRGGYGARMCEDKDVKMTWVEEGRQRPGAARAQWRKQRQWERCGGEYSEGGVGGAEGGW